MRQLRAIVLAPLVHLELVDAYASGLELHLHRLHRLPVFPRHPRGLRLTLRLLLHAAPVKRRSPLPHLFVLGIGLGEGILKALLFALNIGEKGRWGEEGPPCCLSLHPCPGPSHAQNESCALLEVIVGDGGITLLLLNLRMNASVSSSVCCSSVLFTLTLPANATTLLFNRSHS